MRFREEVFRLRGAIWTAFFVAVAFFASPTPGGLLMGIPFVIAGQGVRFWAAGTIRRYRGEKVSARGLVTWGPYAWCRNPLYVGNFLIGLGWSVMASVYVVPAYAAAFFVVYFVGIVPLEENFLSSAFGEEYQRYRTQVPSFFPRQPQTHSLGGPFSFDVLWKSERYSFLVTLFGTLILVLKTFL
jgi:protein-S-isoprenylcysteine O-methyltransferase Ste14